MSDFPYAKAANIKSYSLKQGTFTFENCIKITFTPRASAISIPYGVNTGLVDQVIELHQNQVEISSSSGNFVFTAQFGANAVDFIVEQVL